VSLVLHSRGVLVSVAELVLDECGTYGASLFFLQTECRRDCPTNSFVAD